MHKCMQTGKPLAKEGDGEHLVYIIRINYSVPSYLDMSINL